MNRYGFRIHYRTSQEKIQVPDELKRRIIKAVRDRDRSDLGLPSTRHCGLRSKSNKTAGKPAVLD